MYNPFTKHPKDVNETYFEHMCCAFKFHCTLLKLSLCALVHAIFPFISIPKWVNLTDSANYLLKENKKRS